MAKKWYALYARSSYEEKVKVMIEELVERHGAKDLIADILIPTEAVIELKNGQRKETKRKFFPGYMLINMELTEEIWFLIKNTKHVINFIGGSLGKPSPIPQREIDNILTQVQEGTDKPKPKVAYQLGEEVLVTSGPFNEFTGVIESVNYEKSILKIEVIIFGRSTPVELKFSQIEKV